MEYEVKKNSGVSVEITITNTANEVEEVFQATYQKARQRLQLPGFRRGKVPLALVEKHLGDSVTEEAAQTLIRKNLENCIETLDPRPISLPQFNVEHFDREKGALFSGSYETLPEISLGNYKDIRIKEEKVVVDDAAIDRHIEGLRHGRGVLYSRENEPAAEKDLVTVDLQISSAGKKLYSNKELKISLGEGNTLPGLNEKIIGMHNDESKSFELRIEPDFPDKKYAGQLLQVNVRLLLVQYIEYPQIDDEFAKDVGGGENLAELRKKCQKIMEEAAGQALRADSSRRILEQVVKRSNFNIPPSLVRSTLEREITHLHRRLGLAGEKPDLQQLAHLLGKKPQELQAQMEERASHHVANELILSELSRELQPEVEDGAITEEIEGQYGEKFPKEQLQELLDNSELRERVKATLVNRKILDWLYENADVRHEGKVNFHDLQKKGWIT